MSNGTERTQITIEPDERRCPACDTPSRTLYYGNLTADMSSRKLFGNPSDHRFVCDSDCSVEVFRGRSVDARTVDDIDV